MSEEKAVYLCGRSHAVDDCVACKGPGVCEDVVRLGPPGEEVGRVSKGLTWFEQLVLEMVRQVVARYVQKHPKLTEQIDRAQRAVDELQASLTELPVD